MTAGSEPTPIEEISRLTSLVDAQARVLDLVGDNAPLDKVLRELAALFEAQIEDSTVSILLANADATALIASGAPNLDPAYCAAIDPLPIAENSDACGTAAWRREPVITEDITTDPNWEATRSAALAAGFRACWSVPVIGTDQQVLGTFAVYWRHPATPTSHDLWVQHQFARLTQVAIERARTVDRITQLLDDERRHIAAEIHDDPIQAVTAVGLQLQRLASTASEMQRPLVADAQAAVNGAVERLRSMLFELHPPTLEEDGLVTTVEVYLEECLDPHDIAWKLDSALKSEPTSALAALAYRLTREALANVIKHANAKNVAVSLSDINGGIEVRISDDGAGFETSSEYRDEPGHMGLTNCHYLARRALGWWHVTSSPACGTVVEFWLPAPSS